VQWHSSSLQLSASDAKGLSDGQRCCHRVSGAQFERLRVLLRRHRKLFLEAALKWARATRPWQCCTEASDRPTRGDSHAA
jgi:hypothetical protein